MAFLFAITSVRKVSDLAALSCKEPYLILHHDKVVLRPVPSFLPKAVSEFHLNQDIVLPSFFSQPGSPEEKQLHLLDMVWAVRSSDAFFVLLEGTKKGQGLLRRPFHFGFSS